MEFISEPDAIEMVGAERFKRLRAGNWLSPFHNIEGREGVPLYRLDLVQMRLKEDRRIYPALPEDREELRATVTKGLTELESEGVRGWSGPHEVGTFSAAVESELAALRADSLAVRHAMRRVLGITV